MAESCLASYFADQLNRYRSLTADEAARLENALCRRGLTKRPWTDADDAELRRLRAGRMQAPEIARQLNRTPWSVRNRTKRLKERERG